MTSAPSKKLLKSCNAYHHLNYLCNNSCSRLKIKSPGACNGTIGVKPWTFGVFCFELLSIQLVIETVERRKQNKREQHVGTTKREFKAKGAGGGCHGYMKRPCGFTDRWLIYLFSEIFIYFIGCSPKG